MSLNYRTIAKVLREHFVGDTPITKNASEQKKFISFLKSELKKIPDISLPHHYSSYGENPKYICHFSLQDKSTRYGYGGNSFTIQFSQDNNLIIKHYDDTANIYQVEQIYSFLDKLKLKLEERRERRLKREKVKSLKRQAITAKIKEIAKEDEFDFYIREYDMKMKLIVRIEDAKILEVDIPYGKFQDILKNVRSIVQDIRKLQKSGITFRLKSISKYYGHAWITHESL